MARMLGFASHAFWLAAVVPIARDIGIELGIATLMAVTALSEIIRLLPLTFQGGGDPAAGSSWAPSPTPS